MEKHIIYQLLPRLWGNKNEKLKIGGSLEENGTGKFSDIDRESLEYLKWLGCSHVWYTGIIRHATKASAMGCIPSHPQFVKGNAGSPYAITDYYDVNPYLADIPSRRMEEFEELVKRTHEAGLKVIIDFVPNHVSRDYGKFSFTSDNSDGMSPESVHPVLGADDDKSVHWAFDNDFFYYPGEALKLPVRAPKGMEAYQEMPAMATGNNCFTSAPGINDWYETIKINYCDTHSPTWNKMYDIVRFWASKGVDGFRCDMVELVPAAFFTWMIAEIKREFSEVIFIAEIYQKDNYRKYIREVGFDLLYDKSGLYDSLRAIVEKNVADNGFPVELWQSAERITRDWQFLGDMQPYMLNFLENHDEQRLASEFFAKDAGNGMAALYVSLFLNRAPFMIYMGEEMGERAEETEGFSGADGRTSIFDWWSCESLRRLNALIHSGAYKESHPVFTAFTEAVRFAASSKAVREGMSYDLCYYNTESQGFDVKRHFAFLRDHENETLLFVSNFSAKEAQIELRIPPHAFEWMQLPVTKLLNPETPIRVNVPPMGAIRLALSE